MCKIHLSAQILFTTTINGVLATTRADTLCLNMTENDKAGREWEWRGVEWEGLGKCMVVGDRTVVAGGSEQGSDKNKKWHNMGLESSDMRHALSSPNVVRPDYKASDQNK
jgi:hypothetical protein